MPLQYRIHRYAAYFKGWCQAFGEHEDSFREDADVNWLFGEEQIGFILPQDVSKALYHAVLLRHHESPTLVISEDSVWVGGFHYQLTAATDLQGLDAIRQILKTGGDFHLFLTSHFIYKAGTRIITLSRRKPLPIIYKEIGPMNIELV